MSATTDTNASTDTNQTVAVIPAGIAGNPYYIEDEAQFLSMVEAELDDLAATAGPIADVVVRGSSQLSEMFDDHLSSSIDADWFSMDFRMFLDDEGSNKFDVPSVIGEGSPVVEYVEAVHGSEVAAEFDLGESQDRREYVDGDVLSLIEEEGEDEVEGDELTPGQERIIDAKAKSKAKGTEILLNDHYSWAATADHVIILEDGTSDYEDIAAHTRGNNKWVKISTACEGEIRSVRMSGGEDGVLNWTHAMLARGQLKANNLSDEQVARLNGSLNDEQLKSLGVPIKSDASGDDERDIQAEARAVAGDPAAPADD